jgi:hypothetical protein
MHNKELKTQNIEKKNIGHKCFKKKFKTIIEDLKKNVP